MNAKIGPRLARVRKLRNMTQGQLAERVGVTKQTISNYENGVRMPDFEILDAISIALNTTLSYLIGSSDDPDEKPRKAPQDIGDQRTAPSRSPEWRVLSEGLGILENENKAAFQATYNYLTAMYPDIFTERTDDDDPES